MKCQTNEVQAGIKVFGRNSNNLRYADDTTLMAESEEEIKILQMTMKEESEKAGLKLKKWRSWHLVPITSWQIDGETMETLTDFIFLGSKITADGDYRHEIKRYLLFGRKAMTHLDRILKSRDITLLTKIHIVKTMVFPIVMYGCELDHKESRVSKNLCFWTVVLEETLKSPLDSKEIQPVPPKGNQS